MTDYEIIEQIKSGALDKHLGAISTALQDRLTTIRSTMKNTDFGVGDRVRVNSNCGTRYLIGHYATVVGRKKVKLLIKLDKPVGRFARVLPDGKVESSTVTVPISIVDPA